MTYENQIIVENKKPIELVQKIENYQIKKSPLSPAARGKVVNKSGSNFSSEKEGYGPMTLYRDIAPFEADFSSNANNYLHRGLFQDSDKGTISKNLELRGIDAMKKALRKLESGRLKVVRNASNRDQIRYERIESREEEVKEALRKRIESLENDYSHYYEGRQLSYEIVGSLKQH